MNRHSHFDRHTTELRFPVRSVSRRLSTKLTIGLLLLAIPIFLVSLGLLFNQSRHMLRNEAIGRASSALGATMQRLCQRLQTVETATNSNSWLITQDLNPYSILALTNRIVQLNSHADGCSISTDPYVFEEFGRYFSAYTVRKPLGNGTAGDNAKDTVETVIEEQYEYFDKIWYKKAKDTGEPCWVVFFDESDSLQLTLDGMIASYSKPVYDDSKKFIGIISTDLSLLKLSKVINQEKPYPNSYFMMIDTDGRYIIHPNSDRLFTHTIFEGVTPRHDTDIIALGHEMTSGNTGNMAADIDGKPSLVCYQPVPGTSWSLAIVCPDSDVLKGYNRLSTIILIVLIAGLILILFMCYRTVAQAIRPLNELLVKTQDIATGNMEVHIPKTDRIDAVGRLQNSFASMLRSLNFHMGSVRYSTDQAMQRNEELAQATHMVEEAERQKTAFIQNVTHQIRTPLNIIMGFAQILSDSAGTSAAEPSLREGLSEEEMKSITNTMRHNAKLLTRMIDMLFDSSYLGFSEEMNSNQIDMVACNDIARESISFVQQYYRDCKVALHTNVADDFSIQTNHLYLMRCLREILYNAAKYSDGEHIEMFITKEKATVRFIVQDTGDGIAEEDRERLFEFFAKVDDLSEGLGLGLPLVKRHTMNLGGDLTLDTDYRDGCRFIIEMPIK